LLGFVYKLASLKLRKAQIEYKLYWFSNFLSSRFCNIIFFFEIIPRFFEASNQNGGRWGNNDAADQIELFTLRRKLRSLPWLSGYYWSHIAVALYEIWMAQVKPGFVK
jgi:hypothetical protein